MELYIRLQVQTIAAALALGAAAVLVYELLRTVRLNRRRRWVTHLTDGVYVLAAFWALLRFTLSIGQGELRLYVLPCAALGALLSRQLLAPFFPGRVAVLVGRGGADGPLAVPPGDTFFAFL